MEAPFKVGDLVTRDQLLTWQYVGLSGKPGLDRHSVRRFKKGDWTLEVRALKNPLATSRVASIRTLAEDDLHWSETRTRLMRHRHQRD